MKPRYFIGGAIALAALAVAFFSLDSSKIEYTNIAYAQSSGKRVQVKGAFVKTDGCRYDSQANTFTFTMRDDNNTLIKVIHNGAKPNNFELAESIVVKGRVENGVMMADHILTKCPSKYENNGSQLQSKQPQS
jgi:cytochrome c-type biogenesis protein CcmE